jgi:hypothetical protein
MVGFQMSIKAALIFIIVYFCCQAFTNNVYAVQPNPNTWTVCFANSTTFNPISGFLTPSEACGALDRALGSGHGFSMPSSYKSNCNISSSVGNGEYEYYSCDPSNNGSRTWRYFTCPANSTNSLNGSCTCDVNYVDMGTTCELATCPNNEYYSNTQHQCAIPLACPNGTFNTSTEACEYPPCPAGYERVTAGAACTPVVVPPIECPAGQYHSLSENVCKSVPNCGTGSLFNTQTEKCVFVCTSFNADAPGCGGSGVGTGTGTDTGTGSGTGSGSGSGTGSGSGSGSGSGNGSSSDNYGTGTGTGSASNPDSNTTDNGDGTSTTTPSDYRVDFGDVPTVGTPSTFEVKTDDFSYTSFGSSGSCPAPKTINTSKANLELSYRPYCDYATGIKPFVVLVALILGAFIVTGYRRE